MYVLLCLLVSFVFTILPTTSQLTNNEILHRENQGERQTSSGICNKEGECRVGSIDAIRSQHRSQRLPRQAGACVLPLYPEHGTYEVSNAPNAYPGQTFDYVTLTVSCRRGYGVVQPTDDADKTDAHRVYCINGKWSQSIPKCVRFCKLDPDPSVRYMCHVSGTNGFKACDKYMAPGTSVSPVCNSPIYHSPESLLYMKCEAGTWNYIAKCKAECGRVTPEGKQLIIDGRQAKRGELPWHVGVYHKTFKPYKQICGGSLVSNNVVISAAHCFWHDVRKLLPPTEFAVAVSKIHRSWNSEHDMDAQKSEVKQIMVPRQFEGDAANFQEDIAIMSLVTAFEYKTYVRPVCLSFDVEFDRWQLQIGKLGKVAGWGLTKINESSSLTLNVVELPYASTETCINTLSSSFREYITGDKFCAGYTNSTTLGQGVGGSGLSFADKDLGIDRYYLRGVVSTSPRNENKSSNHACYITFTQITKHEQFIKQSIAALDKKPCEMSEFQCSDGTCVDQTAECNGKQECADGSDESDYLCKPENNTNLQKTSKSCILPPYPDHGVYTVANLMTARPGQLLDSFVITVSCDLEYGIADSSTKSQKVYCVNGAWYQIMPKCIRFCRIPTRPSIHFVTCQVPGSGFTACRDYVTPGTTVVPVCNAPDYYSTQDLAFLKCVNGSWDYIPTCKPAFCTLDPDPKTRYMCRGADEDEFKLCGNTVSSGVTVKPTCHNAGNMSSQVFENMTCSRGTWNFVSKCKTDFCQLNPDPSISYMCHDPVKNELKTCNSSVPVGTSVKPVCNTPYYRAVGVLRNMTCTDESWDYIAQCQAECGRITSLKLQTSLQDGGSDHIKIIKDKMIPWHVQIKDLNELKPWEIGKEKRKEPLLKDYGTLVRNNVVISDAHSFYDYNRQRVDTFTKYTASIANSGSYDTKDNLQTYDVQSIHVPSELKYINNIYLYDIAVLITAKPFIYNLFVSPACLDFNFDFEEEQLAVGNVGKLGYWGHFEVNKEVTTVDKKYCRNLPLTRDIFEDKICATYSNGSEYFLQRHNNVGVFFPRNELGIVRYYFRGIVNAGCYIYMYLGNPYCKPNFIWLTKISKYREFIEQYI